MSSKFFRPRLILTALEDRTVPAVAAFSAATGRLALDLAQDASINVAYVRLDPQGKVGVWVTRPSQNYYSFLPIVGAPAGGIVPSSVRSIAVDGSARGETIDLSNVTSQAGFVGLNGRVTVNAGDGYDSVIGSQFGDAITGGTGTDRLYGGDGDDTISGNDGDDFIYGGNGNDRLFGGNGNDFASGDAGDDEFTGGLGRDEFIGGAGNDRFFDFTVAGDIRFVQ